MFKYCVPEAISSKLNPRRPLAVEDNPSCSSIISISKSDVQLEASPETLQTVSVASYPSIERFYQVKERSVVLGVKVVELAQS